MLLRPKTGLKDMYLALDPGTRSAGELPEGGRVRVANTLPGREHRRVPRAARRGHARVPPDPAERGRHGVRRQGHRGRHAATSRRRRRTCARSFKRFEPTARDGGRITRLLIERRQNIRRVIHNFQELSTALARRDDQLASLVDSANANFEAFAAEEGVAPRGAAPLPGRARPDRADAHEDERAGRRARPGARAAAPVRPRAGPRAPQDAAVLRARPRRSSATRSARSRATCSRRCATCARPPRTWQSSPRGSRARFGVLNRFFNMLAYDPPGAGKLVQLLGRAGPRTPAPRCSTSRTPTGRSGAASCS